MKQIRKGGFRRFAVVVAVAALGILAVGAQAASAGTLEICKSGANGMAGKTFHYTVSPGGNALGYNITPAGSGFTCTSVIDTGAANTQATVTESDVTTTSEVATIAVIPSSREIPGTKDLALKKVTVSLGTTTFNETQVRYTNQPVGGNNGTLKVCKLTETPAFVGRLFSFQVGPVGGPLGPAVSTPANDSFDDPANWSCRILGTFQTGSHVAVHEQIPAGVEVQFIDTDPGANLVDFNTDTGDAEVIVGSGTTIVLYDDEPIPPTGTGFLEICKNPPGFQDPAVTGSWHFTITDQNGDPVGPVGGVDVITNQCSFPLQVPAGILTVTETARAGFQLTSVFTTPTDALVNSNILNRTVDVEVPTSDDPADEVQVSFVNQAIRNQLKICKALGANSSVLIGQTFYFRVTDITDPAHPVALGTTSVTAGATTQCVIFGNVPLGTIVQVDEVFGPDNPLTPFDESGQFITTTSPATKTIGSGINTVTITNTAFGQMEICKNPVAGLRPAAQPTFQFRIDNGGIISVRAGTCSPAKNVSVGNHTVTEVASSNYDVVAITVNPAGRLVGAPDLVNRTVTVNVPYGPSGETVVTYTNAIKTGTVKVCKTIPLTSANSLSPLAGRTYNFNVNVMTAPGNPGTFTPFPLSVTLADGVLSACSGFIGPFPVLQADGSNTIIGVQEGPSGGGFVVDDIVPSFTGPLCSGTAPAAGPYPGANCIPTGKDLATRNINFFLGAGPQFVTFYQHAT